MHQHYVALPWNQPWSRNEETRVAGYNPDSTQKRQDILLPLTPRTLWSSTGFTQYVVGVLGPNLVFASSSILECGCGLFAHMIQWVMPSCTRNQDIRKIQLLHAHAQWERAQAAGSKFPWAYTVPLPKICKHEAPLSLIRLRLLNQWSDLWHNWFYPTPFGMCGTYAPLNTWEAYWHAHSHARCCATPHLLPCAPDSSMDSHFAATLLNWCHKPGQKILLVEWPFFCPLRTIKHQASKKIWQDVQMLCSKALRWPGTRAQAIKQLTRVWCSL